MVDLPIVYLLTNNAYVFQKYETNQEKTCKINLLAIFGIKNYNF